MPINNPLSDFFDILSLKSRKTMLKLQIAFSVFLIIYAYFDNHMRMFCWNLTNVLLNIEQIYQGTLIVFMTFSQKMMKVVRNSKW